jgi:peptidyl-prolyl cis-trans isomerase SurA
MLNVTHENLEARSKRLEEIVAAAKRGSDFCKLIANNSDDATTRDTCGSAGPIPMKNLPPEVQQQLEGMKAGDFSPVMRINFAGMDRLLVFERMSEPRIPTYDEVKTEMSQRAVLEALEHQRRLWLQELRRGIYIDLRLN